MKRPEPVLTRGLAAAPRHHNIRNPCLPRATPSTPHTAALPSEHCYKQLLFLNYTLH